MGYIKEFELFRYPWDTKKGLCYYLFYWFVFILLFFSLTKFNISLINFFVYLWIIPSGIFSLYWAFKRINYIYLSGKLHVVFAVTIDYENEELLRIYKELINDFREKLKDYNLGRKVKVKVKNFDIKFSDNSAAEAKTELNMPCSTLIISGLPITSRGETEFKLNFHYEFIRPGKKNEKEKDEYYKKIIGLSVSKSLGVKSWSLKNNIYSKKALYGGLFNAATYILALCIGTTGYLDDAEKLLKPTINECNDRINKEPTKYGPLTTEVKNLLFSIYYIRFDTKKWNLDVHELSPLAEKMYQWDKYNFSALMSMAIVSELRNERNNAREYTRRAEIRHRKNIIIYKFNHLYFYLTEGNYKQAVGVLDELSRKLVHETDIGFIVKFLYYKYEETKDIALLFNIGSVGLLGGAEKFGENELRNFINIAEKKDNKYKILIDKAKELIK